MFSESTLDQTSQLRKMQIKKKKKEIEREKKGKKWAKEEASQVSIEVMKE